MIIVNEENASKIAKNYYHIYCESWRKKNQRMNILTCWITGALNTSQLASKSLGNYYPDSRDLSKVTF